MTRLDKATIRSILSPEEQEFLPLDEPDADDADDDCLIYQGNAEPVPVAAAGRADTVTRCLRGFLRVPELPFRAGAEVGPPGPSRTDVDPVSVCPAIGRHGADLSGVALTTKRRSGWVDVGTGPWDSLSRTSYAKVSRLLDIDPDDVHLPGVFVQRVVELTPAQAHEKDIEKLTTRPREAATA